MTMPDEELKTLLKTVRLLWKEVQKGGMTMMEFAVDAGISISTMFTIIRYPKYKPGKYVQQQLRVFVKKLRQKYPIEVS